MNKLGDFIDSIVDNRGKNPPYYSLNKEHPVIDNFLINGDRYPSLDRVKRFLDRDTYKGFIRKYVQRDDVVVTLVGNGVGNCCLVPDDHWIIIQNTIGLRTKPSVYNRYLYYYLKLHRNRIAQLDGGSSQPNVRLDNFLQLEVKFHPFNEQVRISEVLYALDSKISLNNRVNAELEAMAKTIYDYWFVQFDFPISKEQAKAMGKPQLEGKPYQASGGKMAWSDELKREIPAIWKAESLRSIIEFNPSISLPKGTEASYIDMDALPQNGFMTKSPMKKAFNGGMKFQNGDVAVARITPCLENGKTGLITLLKDRELGFGSTEFIILRGRKFDLRSFASCLARSDKFRAYAISKMTGTSGRKRVSASDLEMYITAIPDDDTLKRFEKLLSPFFEKMTLNALENQKLAELRDWLLPMLMNGQVKIEDVEQEVELVH